MFPRIQLKCVLSLVLVFAASAMAQWTANTSLNTPVDTSSNEQQNPTMTSDGAGGVIVVWEEDFGGSTSLDIIAQRIDASGNARWGTDGVSISVVAGDQRFPTIVADGLGGAIIAWYDGRGVDTDIYAQRVDATGSTMWSANGVPVCLAAGNQWDPVITSDDAGGAIITWYEARYDTAADIFAQRVNGAGVVQWAIDGVPLCSELNGQVTPVITSDGGGGAIVAWLDFRNGVVELFSQRVSQSGMPLWADDGVRVCDGSDFQYAPDLTSDGTGGAIITWNDFRTGEGSDIYAQRINSAGMPHWPATGIGVCIVIDYQYRPRIVSDGLSGAIICWYDYRNGVNSDIFAQRVTPLGGSLWSPNGVQLCGAINDQQFPTLVRDGRGGAFVGWQDTRNGSNPDIFAQHVNDLGVAGFVADGIAVSTATNGQEFPRLVGNFSGGAILAWGDRRTGIHQDIYAHRIVLGNPDAAFGYWVGGIATDIEAAPAYAGLHQSALDGSDPRDILEPSTLPANYVSVTSVSTTADRYLQDVRQETPELAHTAKRWALESRTSETGSLVNLVFTEDRLPSQFTPVLYAVESGSYTDLRSVPVYSYTPSSTPGEPTNLLLLLGDSTKPSISVVSPNGGEVLVAGFPYTITWNSSDSSGLLRHYIYYTLTGTPPYTLLDSTIGQSSSYEWTPMDASMGAFLRIITVDSVLNVNFDTSDTAFTIVSGDSVAYTTFAGWNMVGVPVLQTDMSPQGIFADDFGGSPINVFGFSLATGYSVPDTLRLGKGYWLNTPTARDIDAVGTAQESVTFPLEAGWNIIGNPFPAPLQKSLLRFTDGITVKTISEAHSAGWLVDLLYGFDGSAYVQENVSLAVWNAYWAKILVSNLFIIFDLNPSPARGVEINLQRARPHVQRVTNR